MKKIGIMMVALIELAISVYAGPTRHDQNPMKGEVPPHSVRRSDLLIPWAGFVIDEPRLQYQGYSGNRAYGRAICVGKMVSERTGEEEAYDSADMNARIYATRVFRLYKPLNNVTMWNNYPGKWRWEVITTSRFFICYTDRGIVCLPEMPQKGMRVQPY